MLKDVFVLENGCIVLRSVEFEAKPVKATAVASDSAYFSDSQAINATFVKGLLADAPIVRFRGSSASFCPVPSLERLQREAGYAPTYSDKAEASVSLRPEWARPVKREANIKRPSAPYLRIVKCENESLLAFSSHSSELVKLRDEVYSAMAVNGACVNSCCLIKRVTDSESYALSEEAGFNGGVGFRTQKESYVLAFPKETELYLNLSQVFPFKSSSPDFNNCSSLFVKDEVIETVTEEEHLERGYKVSAQRLRSYKKVSSFGPSSPDSAAIVGLSEDGLPIIKAVSIEQYERERRDSEAIHAIVSAADISGSRNVIEFMASQVGSEFVGSESVTRETVNQFPVKAPAIAFNYKSFADKQRIRKSALSKRVMSEKALELANVSYRSLHGKSADRAFLDCNDKLDDLAMRVKEYEEILATLPTYNGAWLQEKENAAHSVVDSPNAVLAVQVKAKIADLKAEIALVVEEKKEVREFVKAIYKELAKEAALQSDRDSRAKMKETDSEERAEERRALARARKARQREREKEEKGKARLALLAAQEEASRGTADSIKGEFAETVYGQ